MEVLSRKWLNVKKEIAYKEILICTSKAFVTDVGRYVEKVTCNWLNKIKGL
jgi:hypothetical protein